MGEFLTHYWSVIVTVCGLLVHIGMTRQRLADVETKLKQTEAKVENVRLIEQQIAQHSLAIVDLRNDQHDANKTISEIKIMLAGMVAKVDHICESLEQLASRKS